MKYQVQVNNGNANLGVTQKTISVNEVVETVDQKFLSHHMFLHNSIIPEQVVSNVLENFITCAAELMAQGYAIVLKSGQDAAVRLYGDIHVNGGNINLERARELMENTQLTEQEMVDHATELVQKAGVTVRARAEVEKKLTDLLLAQGASVNRVGDVKEIAFVETSQNADGGSSQGGNTGGDNGGSGSGSGSGGNETIPESGGNG